VEDHNGREAGGEHRPDEDEGSGRGEITDPQELAARLAIKDNHIRELYEEITAFRLAADEASASKAAGEGHIEALERECAGLKERIRDLEEAQGGLRATGSAPGARARTQGSGDLPPRLPARAPRGADGGRGPAGPGAGTT
jgi:hypothetical protein